VEFSETIAML
jgi:hypothetical protein